MEINCDDTVFGLAWFFLLLLVLGVLAIAATKVAPYECNAQPDIVELKNLAPSLAHPFGTDEYSRDVLSRIICGSQVSLSRHSATPERWPRGFGTWDRSTS